MEVDRPLYQCGVATSCNLGPAIAEVCNFWSANPTAGVDSAVNVCFVRFLVATSTAAKSWIRPAASRNFSLEFIAILTLSLRPDWTDVEPRAA